MLSLRESIEWLEREFPPNSTRFRLHEELPFAILRYAPEHEWQLRQEARHLATRIEGPGLGVVRASLADLMWQAINRTEGLDAIVELEKQGGFAAAQEQVGLYLSDPDFSPLADMLAALLSEYDPSRHVCFLMRAGALGPSIYRVSSLLEEMHGRTQVPTVLFYPGESNGSDELRFMGLSSRDTPRNYRVKVYG